jgi:hypothetical protein
MTAIGQKTGATPHQKGRVHFQVVLADRVTCRRALGAGAALSTAVALQVG